MRILRSRGIIVRRVGAYGLPQCLRITVGTAEECNRVAEALTEFMPWLSRCSTAWR